MGPGEIVRAHRLRRRLSQLELAGAAGVSTRHLSYVETGRSRPGRGVLAALARALHLPPREANRLMHAAGERPLHVDRGLEAPDTAPLRAALDRMLAGHMPYPALVTDHAWHSVRANPAAEALIARLASSGGPLPPSGNLLEWLFAPHGLRPLVANWPAVGPFLLDRVRQEAVRHPDLDALAARLSDLAPDAVTRPRIDEEDTVLPLHLVVGGDHVRLFSVLASFGSALDAHVADLRLEYLFPADETTRAWLERASGAYARPGAPDHPAARVGRGDPWAG